MFYRAAMMEGSGTLEDQLEATKVIYSPVLCYLEMRLQSYSN